MWFSIFFWHWKSLSQRLLPDGLQELRFSGNAVYNPRTVTPVHQASLLSHGTTEEMLRCRLGHGTLGKGLRKRADGLHCCQCGRPRPGLWSLSRAKHSSVRQAPGEWDRYVRQLVSYDLTTFLSHGLTVPHLTSWGIFSPQPPLPTAWAPSSLLLLQDRFWEMTLTLLAQASSLGDSWALTGGSGSL